MIILYFFLGSSFSAQFSWLSEQRKSFTRNSFFSHLAKRVLLESLSAFAASSNVISVDLSFPAAPSKLTCAAIDSNHGAGIFLLTSSVCVYLRKSIFSRWRCDKLKLHVSFIPDEIKLIFLHRRSLHREQFMSFDTLSPRLLFPAVAREAQNLNNIRRSFCKKCIEFNSYQHPFQYFPIK